MSKTAWLPLESNPDVINKYLGELGVPNSWQCVDVLGFDPELLQMVPRPVAGVFLLFPITAEVRQSWRFFCCCSYLTSF